MLFCITIITKKLRLKLEGGVPQYLSWGLCCVAVCKERCDGALSTGSSCSVPQVAEANINEGEMEGSAGIHHFMKEFHSQWNQLCHSIFFGTYRCHRKQSISCNFHIFSIPIKALIILFKNVRFNRSFGLPNFTWSDLLCNVVWDGSLPAFPIKPLVGRWVSTDGESQSLRLPAIFVHSCFERGNSVRHHVFTHKFWTSHNLSFKPLHQTPQ